MPNPLTPNAEVTPEASDPFIDELTKLTSDDGSLYGMSFVEVPLQPEPIRKGEYVTGPRVVDFFEGAGEERVLKFRFVQYNFEKPWSGLTGDKFKDELSVVTAKGLASIKVLDIQNPTRVFSVFLGQEKGSPNYVKFAFDAIRSFPSESSYPIERTFWEVPGEKTDPRPYDGLLKAVGDLVARGAKVSIVKTLEQALIGAIEICNTPKVVTEPRKRNR